MTRSDLAERVYDRHRVLTQGQAADLVDIVFDSMKLRLVKHENVLVTNFGTFRVVSTRARAGRNPDTGEAIMIPPRDNIVFRPAAALIQQLNARSGSVEP